ncbi:hypothetical protein LCGC14_3033180, partial [marine sediment metagenome]
MLTKSRAPQFNLRNVHNHLELNGYVDPFLLVDTDILRHNASRFMAAMPRVQPHFAVKSNPDGRVLSCLGEEGVKFEIASKAELDALLDMNVPAEDIYYSNPVKSRRYLQHAADMGVEWYVIDSPEELEKVIAVKPDAKLYLRIYTTNEGSGYALSSKFGAHTKDINTIIDLAAELQADLAGVTFHVGSQCTNVNNWRVGIQAARKVFDQMIEAGLKPRLLNLGGGYPVELGKPVPSIEEIGEIVNQELKVFPDSVRVIAEPGRFMVADAGYFVSQVVGKTSREGKTWLYIDAGFYGGLIELKDGLGYQMLTDRTGDLVATTVA